MKIAKITLLALFTLLSFNTVKAVDTEKTNTTNNSSPEKKPRKSSSVVFTIDMYQIDHTLYFNPNYEGCEFNITIDGNVVYTGIIDEEGIVTLPDYFVGDFDVILDFYGCILTSSITL